MATVTITPVMMTRPDTIARTSSWGGARPRFRLGARSRARACGRVIGAGWHDPDRTHPPCRCHEGWDAAGGSPRPGAPARSQRGVRSGRAALMVARLAGGRLARWFYVSEGQMATTDHVLRTRDVGRLSQRRGVVMRVRVRGLTVPRWDLTLENGQDAHERTRHDSLHPVPASGCPGDVEPYRERRGTGPPVRGVAHMVLRHKCGQHGPAWIRKRAAGCGPLGAVQSPRQPYPSAGSGSPHQDADSGATPGGGSTPPRALPKEASR